jgi:hypothetical protein
VDSYPPICKINQWVDVYQSILLHKRNGWMLSIHLELDCFVSGWWSSLEIVDEAIAVTLFRL